MTWSEASPGAKRPPVRRAEREAWLLFAAAAALLLATVEAAPRLARFLWLRGLFMPVLAGLFGIALCLGAFHLFFVARLRSPRRLLLLLGLLALWTGLLRCTERVERFHLLEYGLLALLGARALAFRLEGFRLYPAAFVAVLPVSAADEMLQAWLPDRYFGISDLMINAGAAAGVLAILACIHGARTGALLRPFLGGSRARDD